MVEAGIEITELPDGSDHNNDEETNQTESVSAFSTLDIESAVHLDSAVPSEAEKSAPRLELSNQSSAASYEHFLAAGMSVLNASQQRASEMFPDRNSRMVLAASFSSSNGSYDGGIQQADSYNDSFHASMFDGSTDELDNYKNQNIEIFREAVEQAVHDIEGMMMLAVTNALTQSPSSRNDEQDQSALEAEYLYSSFDWWKRNEQSPVDSKREYFQDLLNRIVSLVFYASFPPLQASQIVHECATIIGLPLEQPLPQTTIIIQGMLKTNDLATGQKCITRAFKPFGVIQAAAIAPNNHGKFISFLNSYNTSIPL